MDRSKNNLRKLKVYHVSDDEAESYKINEKSRYLKKYLDVIGKPEVLAERGVYDPEGLDEFFVMHEDNRRREFERSRRLSLKNNLPLKFQAVSLLIIFAVVVIGPFLLRQYEAGRHVRGVSDMRAGQPAAMGAPLGPVPFDREIYDNENMLFYVTMETLDRNVNEGTRISEYRIRGLTRRLGMIYMDQHALGMPNGCEITALAMVISRDYAGICVRDIAENYLYASPLVFSGGVMFSEADPAYYYIGNPAEPRGGFGIFAPGLTRTANRLLRAKNIPRVAHDISGISDEELLRHVSRHPVIVWHTLNLTPARWGAAWHLPDDYRAYSYPLNAHSAVLVDFTDTTVILYDPTFGIVEHNRELFLERWGEVGPHREQTRQAVIIR